MLHPAPACDKISNNIIISHLSDVLNNLNAYQFEVVDRYRDPQLQVGENYSYVFNISDQRFANFDV